MLESVVLYDLSSDKTVKVFTCKSGDELGRLFINDNNDKIGIVSSQTKQSGSENKLDRSSLFFFLRGRQWRILTGFFRVLFSVTRKDALLAHP